MIDRERGKELLQEDPQAYLLLSQIAFRAKRTSRNYSRVPLKENQAFIGDHENCGLSAQQYKDTKERLERHGLAIFHATNQGTIATLTGTDVFDINAEESTTEIQQENPFANPRKKRIKDAKEPAESSMKNENKDLAENQQRTNEDLTSNQPRTNEKPTGSHQATIGEPVTIREECKKTTTTMIEEGKSLYECLKNHPDLSEDDKLSLMNFPEQRVLRAIEYAQKAIIKTTLIRTLHWHCRQPTAPLPPENDPYKSTPQQAAAWEFNRFLNQHNYSNLATKNQEAIPENIAYIISGGHETSISLKNSIETVKSDFEQSKNEILQVKKL